MARQLSQQCRTVEASISGFLRKSEAKAYRESQRNVFFKRIMMSGPLTKDSI